MREKSSKVGVFRCILMGWIPGSTPLLQGLGRSKPGAVGLILTTIDDPSTLGDAETLKVCNGAISVQALEAKRLERQASGLLRAFDAFKESILVCDSSTPDMRVLVFNDAFATVTGEAHTSRLPGIACTARWSTPHTSLDHTITRWFPKGSLVLSRWRRK